jgi:hypothetical protein
MRLSKQLAVSLALAAMLLRALLPDGWMPASAGSGTPFTICSIDGVHTGGKTQPAHDQHEHGSCAFAAMGHISPPSQPALALAPHDIVLRIARVFADETVVRQTVHRPNAARAPPAFS